MDWGEILKVWVPVATTGAGGLWAFWLYVDHKREKHRAEALEAERANRTRSLESRRPFLELQLRLYVEAAQVVGQLVSQQFGSTSYKEAEKRFWALYWSELSMVESQEVENQMVLVGNVVELLRERGDEESFKPQLRDAAYDLAHIIRREIETAWTANPTVVMDGGKRFSTAFIDPRR